MKQRELIIETWERRSKHRVPTPQFQRAQEFFEMMKDNPNICWDELVAEFRNNYYDAFDEIVPVLLDTDDPLIVYNCVRFADLDNPKEAMAAKKLVQNTDVDKHEVSMVRLAEIPTMRSALSKRSELPESVRTMMSSVAPGPGGDEPTAKPSRPKKGGTIAKPRRATKKQPTS